MQADPTITVVTGLPRSGTSLVMQMLHAGGMPVLADDVRPPDPDNPRGYHEFEPVKTIARDHSWLKQAQGKAVKIVAPLLTYVPPRYAYRLIFVRRPMDEILISQARMLAHRGEPAGPDDEEMERLFNRQLETIEAWLDDQEHMTVLYVAYGGVLDKPRETAERIARFLDRDLDLDAMAAVVDPSLYRSRPA